MLTHRSYRRKRTLRQMLLLTFAAIAVCAIVQTIAFREVVPQEMVAAELSRKVAQMEVEAKQRAERDLLATREGQQ